jgi:intraflagellar transport protein 172
MLGKLAEAARLAEEQKDFKGAARLYESDAQWAVAATCWVRGENYASAAKAYQRAAEVHDSADLWTKAATYYARSKSYGDAAGCYERAADWQRGAESWVALGSLLDAARCYEKAGARDKARDCIAKQHEKNGDFAAAGDAWELLHKWADAARCWEKAGGLQRAQKLYVDAGMPLDSVRLLAALGEHVKAASQYENLRMFDHAAKHYEKAGEWSAAARCWNVIRAWRQEIVCYEKARDWENVGRIRTRDGKHRKAAVAYEQWQRFDLAAASWIAADDFRRAAKAYERAEDWVSAAKQWKRVGSIADVRRCLFTGGAENLLTEIMEKQLLSHVSAESAEITESKIAAASDVSDDKAVYLAPLAPPEGGTDERTAETSFELNTPLAGEDLAPAVFREPTAYAEASATTSAVVDELRQGASTEDVDPRTESRTVTSRTLFKRIRTFIRSVLERH